MTDWQINIPHYGDPDDPVFEIGFAARELPDDDERAVVQRLTMDAIQAGTQTVGDFLDGLEGLSEPARRQRLDQARVACGLESATELDRRREQRLIDARFSDHDIPGPERWSEFQACPAQGCNARPTTPEGALRPVSVNRWWCPRHEHLADPADLEEYEAPYIGVEFGRLIPSEKEKARIAAEIRKRDEPMEEERRQREEHARRESEALDAVRERYAKTTKVSIGGILVSPENIHFHPEVD